MEHTITLGAFLLGGLGWLCALSLTIRVPSRAARGGHQDQRPREPLRERPDERLHGRQFEHQSERQFERQSGRQFEHQSGRQFERASWWVALALPIIVWAATLPVTPPFSAGQGFGRGFLLGGVGCLAASWVVWRAANMGALSGRAAACAPLFAALAVICAPLLWMRGSVIDALLGAGAGWVGVSLVLLLRDELEFEARVFSGAAWMAALCGAAALGVYRDFIFSDVARGTYSALSVALAASVAVALLLAALIAPNTPQNGGVTPRFALGQGAAMLLVTALPLGAAALLALKIVGDADLAYVVAIGVCAGFLLRAVTRDQSAAWSGPAAALIALCAWMAAYQLSQGFGVGLMIIAAWPLAITAFWSRAEAAPTATSAATAMPITLAFAAVLLLGRLFATRFAADLRGAGFEDQYALFGFIAGAALPALGAALLRPGGVVAESRPAEAVTELRPADAVAEPFFLARGLGAVLVGAGVLAVALGLWGAKIAPACFAGLGVGTLGLAWPQARAASRWSATFALALALGLAQWTHHLAPLAAMSRGQRLHLALWSVGLAVLALLVFDYGGRLFALLRARRAPTGSKVSPEVVQ